MMKRGAEKVTVTILMSLDLVLMNFKLAELFCEDKFGDVAVGRTTCAMGWDMKDEKQMEVTRRVRDEDFGRAFDKLIELTRVTGRYLCYLLERFKRHQERDGNEMNSTKMDESRGWFLGMCLVPKHSDQIPVPKRNDPLLKVRVLQGDDVGSVALWNCDETNITQWTDDTDRQIQGAVRLDQVPGFCDNVVRGARWL